MEITATTVPIRNAIIAFKLLISDIRLPIRLSLLVSAKVIFMSRLENCLFISSTTVKVSALPLLLLPLLLLLLSVIIDAVTGSAEEIVAADIAAC